MKYNDRNTQRINKSYQDKNKSELNNITDRSIKRFNKRLYKKFSIMVYIILDKDYWESISYEDRKKLMHNWYDDLISWDLGLAVRIEFKDWFPKELIKLNIKPDPQLLREKRINKLIK